MRQGDVVCVCVCVCGRVGAGGVTIERYVCLLLGMFVTSLPAL